MEKLQQQLKDTRAECDAAKASLSEEQVSNHKLKEEMERLRQQLKDTQAERDAAKASVAESFSEAAKEFREQRHALEQERQELARQLKEKKDCTLPNAHAAEEQQQQDAVTSSDSQYQHEVPAYIWKVDALREQWLAKRRILDL